MTNLTEQLKEGKLPENHHYYYKLPNGDYKVGNTFCVETLHWCKEGDKIQILEEVPSYEKWLKFKNATANIMLQNNALEIISDQLKKENTKLKELLKECCYRIDWTDKTGHKSTDDRRQKLFNDIEQVLKENNDA